MIKFGKNALNDSSKIIEFVEMWNDSNIITGIQTPKLLKIVIELNEKYENSINIGFSPKEKCIRLQYLKDFEDLRVFFEKRKKFPTEMIEGWLIYRRELDGESPFISFQMMDQRTFKLSEFLIFNIKTYKFNNGGLSPASFKPGGTRRALFDNLMNKFHLLSKQKDEEIKNSLEKGLKNALKLNKLVNLQIKHVYQLKFSKNRIDDFFEAIFWKFFEIKKYDWRSEWNQGKSPVLNRIYQYYSLKGRSFVETGISSDLEESKFIIYITDQSMKVKKLKNMIIDKKLLSYNKNNFLSLYKEFQKINHSRIVEIKDGLSFELLHSFSIQYGIGKITDKITKFVTESNKQGITRALAVIMQNKRIRSEITKISKNHNYLNVLNLSESVFSEQKWGNIVTNRRNSIDFPDIVTYEKTTKFAKEKIQLKVLPPKRTKFLRYRYEEILSDYLKSIGCHNPIANTGLVSLRIEYIPPGTSHLSLRKLPSNDHIIIIHYWGRMNPEYQRLGEIYNAVRLAIFNYQITQKEKVFDFVKEKLLDGSEMLSGRKSGVINEKLIYNVYAVYEHGMTERQFIFQVLIKVLIKLFQEPS